MQPWLDCFKMMKAYEQQGLLEVKAGLCEAFVTVSALHAMSEGDDPREQLRRAVPDTVRRLRAYAGWKSGQGAAYLDEPFAVHVVKEEAPHDLLYTLVLERRRRWWWPFVKADCFTTITY